VKRSTIALAVVLLAFGGSCRAEAQGVDGLRIVVRGTNVRADGGDRGDGAGFIDPELIGKTSSLAFWRLEGPCGIGTGAKPPGAFGEASDGTLKKVHSAWAVLVTPTGRIGEAVTFRLEWMRIWDNGKPSMVRGDVEPTLRPGQSMPLDVMSQMREASGSPNPCVAMSLSVAVEYWPQPDQDRRLVAVDLWLMERLANGKERSQQLSLRGQYNQPIPFYFDTVTESTKALDLFGDLRVLAGGQTNEIKLTTRSRVVSLETVPRPPRLPEWVRWPLDQNGATTATLKVAPGEVVALSLPPVGNGTTDAAAFAARALSFRIRVRQIR